MATRLSTKQKRAVITSMPESPAFRAARREYFRECKHAVEIREEGQEDNRATSMAVSIVMDDLPMFRDWRRCEVLIRPGYPKAPWRELGENERENIKMYFVFRAGFTKSSVRARCRGDAEKVLAWLSNDANSKLFRDYYRRPIDKRNLHSPNRYKELLKFLAAWRLYDELGFKEAANWTKENRRSRIDSSGVERVRRFFREKQNKRTRGSQLIELALYGEQREWKAAIREAQSFLEEIEGHQRGVT